MLATHLLFLPFQIRCRRRTDSVPRASDLPLRILSPSSSSSFSSSHCRHTASPPLLAAIFLVSPWPLCLGARSVASHSWAFERRGNLKTKLIDKLCSMRLIPAILPVLSRFIDFQAFFLNHRQFFSIVLAICLSLLIVFLNTEILQLCKQIFFLIFFSGDGYNIEFPDLTVIKIWDTKQRSTTD